MIKANILNILKYEKIDLQEWQKHLYKIGQSFDIRLALATK